jgi:hypothetical protein
MKIAILSTVLVAGSLCLGSPARAQIHEVFVNIGDSYSHEVANALKAKIRSAARYSLTENSLEAEISVSLRCVAFADNRGHACASQTELFTHSGPLSIALSPSIASGPDAKCIADELFAALAAATTEENIKTSNERILSRVHLLCGHAANKQYCEQ